ncbi:LuxR C-terminal-related transcriptional regulator [Streptomyces lavenduligriseus]|uniref:LuxR C-terminal-related transcriptional regulator n=1 Tax=Streptomyces lavenduligriseus TaxID=67315 RepID=A0ABT0NM28_9ACTN|nr:LuxR C-terminal-related transcriptional regulator [Streptomyces lavenduligriseus]MCL3992236.1 LuxR C-terminal-related transcriptional regulator [Streptomyces lavenduligriseus]
MHSVGIARKDHVAVRSGHRQTTALRAVGGALPSSRVETAGPSSLEGELDAVEAVLTRAQAALKEQLARARSLRRELAEMPRLAPVSEEPGRELVLSARREVWVALAPPPSLACLKDAEAQFADLTSQGVALRALYPSTVLAVDGGAEHLERTAELGVECRMVDIQQVFTAVVDQEFVFMAAGLRPGEEGETVFRAPQDVALLRQSFEQTWRSARRVHPGSRARQRLTAEQLTMLRLMSSGVKDEKIARLLGVSSRTLSRLMAGAMEELEARSRFEAGVRAAELGLLS